MNYSVMIGNLTKDPDYRQTSSGHSVTTFTLAVQRKLPKEAERTADFIPVVCWRGLADVCRKYLAKGSKVAVVGKIQTRNYESNGEKRYVTELIADDVEFLSKIQKHEEWDDEFEEEPF